MNELLNSELRIYFETKVLLRGLGGLELKGKFILL